MKTQQSGFTLVEIAIVLVIIGLLLGGVLKGQELINSAKAKAVINDFRNTATMIAAYQDRFRALPGDDNAADKHLAVVGLKSGNGDGKIDGAWDENADADKESVRFWQHLRLANLATGNASDPVANSVNGWAPTNSEGGRIGVSSTAPAGFSGIRGRFFICQGNLDGRIAQQIDSTMDDGDGTTGSVGVADNSTNTAAAAPKEGTVYTVCYGI
ncbi:MAG TPA: prepilin-type N-terminal cleavage/methylation domain-containing protein [Rhodocyclaceae bacterium]|nr:prepilin-type N-terminal cleavage/methylation domain-containing protein [Rhodocyclaceae bacterium]